MAIPEQWLVTYARGDPDRAWCPTLEIAVAAIRMRQQDDPVLWQRAPFEVYFPGAAAEPAPKKKRASRKRKDSTGTATSDGSSPVSPEKAAAPVDVRPPAAAAPAAPPAPAPGPARPSCGGKACEVKGNVDIHRMDPSCSKLMANRKGAAAR